MKSWVFLLLLCICSCAQNINYTVESVHEQYSVDKLEKAKIVVACSDNVILKDYIKTFRAVFPNYGNFLNDFTIMYTRSLRKSFPNATITRVLLDTNETEFLPIGFNAGLDAKKVKDALSKDEIEYLIFLRDITIDEGVEMEIEYNINLNQALNGLGTNISGPTILPTPVCNVSVLVEIWSKEYNQVIYSYNVKHLTKLGLFIGYRETLLNTILNTTKDASNRTIFVETIKK